MLLLKLWYLTPELSLLCAALNCSGWGSAKHIFPLPSGSLLGSVHREQRGRWVDERNQMGLALSCSPCFPSHAFYSSITNYLQFLVFSIIPRNGLSAPCQRCQHQPGDTLPLESEKQLRRASSKLLRYGWKQMGLSELQTQPRRGAISWTHCLCGISGSSFIFSNKTFLLILCIKLSLFKQTGMVSISPGGPQCTNRKGGVVLWRKINKKSVFESMGVR